MRTVAGSPGGIESRTRRLPRARGGLGGLWELMRDPEAQETLRFLIEVGKELRGTLAAPPR